ncbi:MAG TPA: hypothetical protein VFZ78_01915 [Flavisolibacter sp.]
MKQVRFILVMFIIALVVSGATAIPVDPQLSYLLRWFPLETPAHQWISRVLHAYREVNEKHPFLLYGYDWLAFAHFILAILFTGPYRDPVRNIWVIEFGMISCVLVLPLAGIAGYFRGIPLGWQLIDCSFGIVGFAVLFTCYQLIKKYILLQNIN